MIWILVMILYGDGKAIGHVEFNSKEACEEAKEEIIGERGVFSRPAAYCFPKGVLETIDLELRK